jgi:hypothetical protein
MFKKEIAKLAVEILKTAELDDDNEEGCIRVNPDLLFQFYVLINTKSKEDAFIDLGLREKFKETM